MNVLGLNEIVLVMKIVHIAFSIPPNNRLCELVKFEMCC